jgi:hypothetical protein
MYPASRRILRASRPRYPVGRFRTLPFGFVRFGRGEVWAAEHCSPTIGSSHSRPFARFAQRFLLRVLVAGNLERKC